MRDRLSIGVFFFNIGPYHHARLNALARFARVVAFEWSARGSYPWGKAQNSTRYEKITLFSEIGREIENRILLGSVSSALINARLDVVAVNGWNDFGSCKTIMLSSDQKIPVVVMSESTACDEQRVWWKEALKSRIVGLCSAGLVGGRPHKDYLVQLGMPSQSIFEGYDAVDNNYFINETTRIKKRKTELSNQLGLPENFILASARFIGKKNLHRLIQAYAHYRNRRKSGCWDLVLLGDGPLRSSVVDLCSSLGLNGCVHLPGFKQYLELPVYYGLANCFIHASTTEQWGLVVNEAMASGLPVLVSARCGSATELVEVGVNGFTFDPYDVNAIAERLEKLTSASEEQRLAMGTASQDKIAAWGPARFATGLLGASKVALETKPKKIGLIDRTILKIVARR